jgi:zinc-binding in reverse transcriptase
MLWRHQDIIPRIQLFLWRIAQNTLPVGAVWANKLGYQVPNCAIYGLDRDNVMHAIFRCQFARAVWLASPLGLHSHALLDEFIQVFLFLGNNLGSADFKLFLNTMWCI